MESKKLETRLMKLEQPSKNLKQISLFVTNVNFWCVPYFLLKQRVGSGSELLMDP